jgi:2-polyprenyl-3-methyl-5-hydroxy-6-metoxy-1,4-benzoquinol methylase
MQEGPAFYQTLDMSYQDPNCLMARRLEIVLQRVEQGHRLLDIGAGSGMASRTLADRFDHIVPLDINPVALGLLQARSRRFPNLSAVRGDGRRLGFLDQTFDCCLLLDVLEHVRDPDRILDEVWRCLKPRAQLIVSTPNWMDWISCKVLRKNSYHVTFHSPSGWEALVRRAGFRVVMNRAIRFPLINAERLAWRLRLLGMGVVMEAFKGERA